MNLIRYILPEKNRYEVQSARNISFEYLKQGHEVITKLQQGLKSFVLTIWELSKV